MTAINFPANPSNGDTHQGFVYNSTLGVWQSAGSQTAVTSFTGLSDTPSTLGTAGQIAKVNSGATALEFADQSGVTVYANVDALPGSGNTGDLAFVTATNRLYIWNGSGWYNIALINTTPSISGVSSSYDLATDGTATVITITATDPEGIPITYSIASDTSGNIATVTQGTGASSNVFTITPSTNDANAGTFSLTFRASDGVNIASAISEFTLAFAIQDSKYTTALITSVGTDNQVNNTFVDSSTNSHTITVAGNVTQNTFSPYRHGGYSIYCDGANVMNLGFSTLNSGNWTFECWARVEVGETILGKYGGGNQLEAFGVSNTTGYMYTHTNVGVETPTCNTDLRDGKWHYLVWERHNGTYYYWADGSLEASFANSETPGATGNWGLGGVASGRFKGNIKEARFSLSTAVYSGSAPTTPTEPQTTSNATDAFFTGVGLEIKDYSSNNRTFTVPSTFITAPTTPYDYTTYSAGTNGGSMYFDGTGDYLTIPDNSAFDFGTDPFTIEAWINIDTTRGNYDRIVAGGTQADGAGNQWFIGFWPGAQINVGYYNGSSYTETAFNIGSMPNEVWHHLAIVRNGTNVECFFNGVSKGTWNVGTSTAFNTGAAGLIIGHRYNNGSPIEPYHGHISDLRIVKGTAVYTSDFTPPTAPLTAITNTSLLLNGTNAGIIDKSQSAQTLTLNGDVKSSTTQTKYLSSSMYFDGTGDYIDLPDFVSDYGDRDFTVEVWIYPTAVGSRHNFGDFNSSGQNASSSLVFKFDNDKAKWWIQTTTYNSITSAASISANAWTHIALVRNGSTITQYINGNSDGTFNVGSASINQSSIVYTLGTGGDYQADFYQGYMSDFRVTKGLARYTANFTPPTAELRG